ncbi:MAG: helix-turn-helix domain-containing protein, partial [Streptococcaceae bacterium]|nr:helix-turn-helix domain-containing protein [Streptococcaceae bacterium]
MFNGEKLVELRLLHGFSRLELAEKLELTEQAIWQFETNKTEPKLSPTQFSLARLFNVDLSYFDEETSPSYVKAGSIAFRNADITSKRTIKIQEAYLNKAHEIIKYLESFLISPDWIFFDLVQELKSQESESLDMEALASKARKMLAISEDNSDILYKLELSGINV